MCIFGKPIQPVDARLKLYAVLNYPAVKICSFGVPHRLTDMYHSSQTSLNEEHLSA